VATLLAWAKSAKPSASFATDSYDSLDAFIFVGPDGKRHAVRGSRRFDRRCGRRMAGSPA
jgi:hypothetical protein